MKKKQNKFFKKLKKFFSKPIDKPLDKFAKKENDSFTLIELLIVITIIGLLGTVVTVSSIGIRDKARDASMKESLAAFRTEAELFYSSGGDYYDFCSTSKIGELSAISGDANCYDESLFGISIGWAAEAMLTNDSDYYCIDYLGNKGITDGSTISETDVECNISEVESGGEEGFAASISNSQTANDGTVITGPGDWIEFRGTDQTMLGGFSINPGDTAATLASNIDGALGITGTIVTLDSGTGSINITIPDSADTDDSGRPNKNDGLDNPEVADMQSSALFIVVWTF